MLIKYRFFTRNDLLHIWCFSIVICIFPQSIFAQQKIDRVALVSRHNVINTTFDSLSSLSVGNGHFAFTVDVTGLQTFPKAYQKGVPLGTQSEWGWHSFKDTIGYGRTEALKEYNLNGRNLSYMVQWNAPDRNKAAGNWFRQNPHRLQLGNLGFEIKKRDGSIATIYDIKNIKQKLVLWRGEIISDFTVEGVPVSATTYCHQQQDVIGVEVKSELIKSGRLKVNITFPYPTGEWTDVGTNYSKPEKHRSWMVNNSTAKTSIIHQLDTMYYYTSFNHSAASALQKEPHTFSLIPDAGSDKFQFSCRFSLPTKSLSPSPSFAETKTSSIQGWKSYWSTTAAVDFTGSKDVRANELERRIILSLYLIKVQEAGKYPPQETGLTYNSWFGKPHLEMHWWHALHFPLWNQPGLLATSMPWYDSVAAKAYAIAKRQGFEGLRWQKMTDNNGDEAPSSVGAFLIWQQPHYIYFAEMLYRSEPSLATLTKYKDLLFASADFMASYPYFEKEKNRYILGKGLIPAQERFKAEETFNPTYELAYWNWALRVAQQWRERLQLPRNKNYDSVLAKLSKLPVQGNVYLAAESAPDSYTNTNFLTDHPSVLGALGMLPANDLVNLKTMRSTFDTVWKVWHWNDTWGWDFPMTAMTATRLGLPEKAIDALLMNVKTNTYLNNGHNYQDERLTIYLPGNGGLLTAVALMCAGYDGCKTINPGIPKNGRWKVKWEGLKPMP